MITPRHYEEAIREILTEIPKDQQPEAVRKLMIDTLDCLGYAYGNSILRDEVDHGKDVIHE